MTRPTARLNKVKLSALHTAQEAQAAIDAVLGDPQRIVEAFKAVSKIKSQLAAKSEEESKVNEYPHETEKEIVTA